jgi:hypothetical protein
VIDGVTRLQRRGSIAALMGFVAVTLALMSSLHLSGILAGRGKPFDATHAGIAEAVICLALASGGGTLMGGSARARTVAIATTVFAIAGFIVGLNFTVRGGDTIDIAYHASVLPLLLVALSAQIWPARV